MGIGGILLIVFFIGISLFAPLLTSRRPTEQDLTATLIPPSMSHLFGTDDLGRDVLSRVLYGGRITLVIAFLATTAGLVIGTLLGLCAGYFGRGLDVLIMRSIDVLLAFPGILLALTLISVLGFGLDKIIVAISIVTIPSFTRLVRSSTLSIRSIEYVTAARTLGANNTRIIAHHILPNSVAPVVTLWALQIGGAIMITSGLGFLGLGVQPPTPEWGVMLSDSRLYMQIAPYLVVVPGIAIALTVLAFALVGDWLRDYLDPRM